ncbi:portal protein, partial [Vibrio parahaemolyticus]|uniref:portal protein n=1 Tax=Vibrio parahaemolyticus TaxID=670 RepID=UPI001167A671
PDTDIEQFKTKTSKGIKQFKTEGEVELVRVETKIKFDYIPFGEIYVDPIATSIDTARYIGHRTIQTKGELL